MKVRELFTSQASNEKTEIMEGGQLATLVPKDAVREPAEQSVGARLRHLRNQKGMSLKMLAEASGVSVGMISQVERGLANPSVRLLTALRRALNVSMQELFGETKDELTGSAEPEFVRRRKNRPVIELGALRKELLTPTDQRNMQIMIIHIEPGGESGGRALSYPAEKGGLVMSGNVILNVDDQAVALEPGDSFVFDSVRPHSLRNVSAEPAEVLWIISAVQFDRHL
ncbi:helix-turn-helix domain-containing protein [Microvirga pakistanensis]|uniref:helix-turn-helix domain-containing protein n=1 Tax=Microvirga pakistanensis TaxID=1682650 RepID=UPI00195C60D4|nr:helix-turn-helix domain-containing protein [Microvirga pakistanensis]